MGFSIDILFQLLLPEWKQTLLYLKILKWQYHFAGFVELGWNLKIVITLKWIGRPQYIWNFKISVDFWFICVKICVQAGRWNGANEAMLCQNYFTLAEHLGLP